MSTRSVSIYTILKRRTKIQRNSKEPFMCSKIVNESQRKRKRVYLVVVRLGLDELLVEKTSTFEQLLHLGLLHRQLLPAPHHVRLVTQRRFDARLRYQFLQ
jgi:hypothetical protein